MDLVDAVQEAGRDGGRGAHEDDERDGALAALQQENRQWKPGDGWHRLETNEQRADSTAQQLDPRDENRHGDPGCDGEPVTERGTPQRQSDTGVKVGVADVGHEAFHEAFLLHLSEFCDVRSHIRTFFGRCSI